jgi:hypothetical protein
MTYDLLVINHKVRPSERRAGRAKTAQIVRKKKMQTVQCINHLHIALLLQKNLPKCLPGYNRIGQLCSP